MSGYRPNSAYREANVRNLSLPDQIKCQRCSKRKAHRNYSNKQLNDAREKVRRGQEVTAVCMACNGQPSAELECQRCDAWKPLDEFSKVQRKNPDFAVCEKCMAVQVDIEPVEVGGVRGAEDSDDDDGEDYGNTHVTPWGPTTTAPTNEGQSVDLLGMTSRPAATTTAPSSSGFDPTSYAAAARASSTTGSMRANAAATTVESSSGSGGFNPNAYGGASRASSTTGSMRANGPASRSEAFPKPPGRKFPKKQQQQQDDDYDDDANPRAINQQDDDDEETRI